MQRSPASPSANSTDNGREWITSGAATAMSRLASWRVWFVLAAAFAVCAGVFFRTSAPFSIEQVERLCGAPPLDVRFTSTAADVERFLSGCGIEGRNAYRNMLVADLVYPLVFGTFMASSLALAITRVVPHRPRLIVVALAALVGSALDYVENALEWRAVDAFPTAVASTRLLGIVAAGKSIVFWMVGVGLLVLLVVIGIREIGARRQRRTADMMV